MAGGWTRDGAVQDQVDASVEDAVEHACRRLPRSESLLQCEDCGVEIPEGRREALPGVRLCVECQSERDRHDAPHAGYNRRGSKDSQLTRRSVRSPVHAGHNAWREPPRTSTRARVVKE